MCGCASGASNSSGCLCWRPQIPGEDGNPVLPENIRSEKISAQRNYPFGENQNVVGSKASREELVGGDL